ncbi:hypothetical protein [Vandammella animalimorsus]|uniref:hypothetical protein n=1 Tax=Vandammella animalimorsus TaxID=2029117 RepID=UPI0011C437A5|nr:hypothetical protein [Vandammella animalimorsus]
MRYAPHSLHYPVARSARAGFLVLAACGAALLPPLLWSLYAGWQGRPAALTVGLLLTLASLLCSALAWRHWRRSAQGVLFWNGAAWHWAAGQQQSLEASGQAVATDAQPGLDLEIVWDGQHFMLLRQGPPAWPQAIGRPDGNAAPRWLWIEQAQAPALWSDVRRTLYHWQRLGRRPGARH